ncbi:MAG: HEPN domain-containing protein [Desulfuromonadales bacterium]|nr:HEPN domain-containing protein [Desulfuromonadales bacterium]
MIEAAMVEFSKQVVHWRDGAEEDWAVAIELVESGRIRHGLFFAHLSLEKTLKALICKNIGELAPPIHNLVRLKEKAGITLNDSQVDLLAEVNEFNIEGRYPELSLPLPLNDEARNYLRKISELLTCLNRLF